jgi:hypothetical protein
VGTTEDSIVSNFEMKLWRTHTHNPHHIKKLKANDKAKQKLQNVKIKQTSVLSLPSTNFQMKQNPPPPSPFSLLLFGTKS